MKRSIGSGSVGALRSLGALIGMSVALGACSVTEQEVVATVPSDYRLRHPIAVEEADRAIVIFVGSERGGLSDAQRADVVGLARRWVHDGTGAVIADVPVGTPNARAAASTFREIRSLLAAGGVPPRGIILRKYRPDDPAFLPPIRLSYPRIMAIAGPCGEWPADLGPSIMDPGYGENRPYYNFGCATQRNLAAMIDNPADLEQPRSETPPYTMRRNAAFEKYRKGESTTTNYPETDKAKLSDTGK
ncbi:CpaD family pilus assembly protein [Bradyrhizobium sp.]|uniref:CpaD family pilus assembly protein n=1 Tax=Bradyrhizobium sp. TaxID=376 RepID=UPI001EC8B3B0|nr:CpaD family pilus assembly protein [Bradyrhizobium sp.]MBV8921046.1 CpaD family pilus assembly protein [Bradyrhizobium sp.]MBV9980190.1 CpaD family pilus assembly protein [Bradyrhizobium sp.]